MIRLELYTLSTHLIGKTQKFLILIFFLRQFILRSIAFINRPRIVLKLFLPKLIRPYIQLHYLLRYIIFPFIHVIQEQHFGELVESEFDRLNVHILQLICLYTLLFIRGTFDRLLIFSCIVVFPFLNPYFLTLKQEIVHFVYA